MVAQDSARLSKKDIWESNNDKENSLEMCVMCLDSNWLRQRSLFFNLNREPVVSCAFANFNYRFY